MDIEEIKKSFLTDLEKIKNQKDIEKIRVKYLGRQNGKLTQILRSLKYLPIEKRKEIGSLANSLRKEIEELLDQKIKMIRDTKYMMHEKIDITRPGIKPKTGHLHVLTQVEQQIRQIFSSINFSVVEGPEIEDEFHNFDALNIPKDHPARDSWNTFWLKYDSKKQIQSNTTNKLLLRTHTSPMQIHYMETHEPPFQIIVPGKVFRYEATDASHETNFYQVEGLMVGEDVSLANFKFIVEEFFKKFFEGQKIEFRFRPSYFPFVEPGVEVDIQLSQRSKVKNQKSTWLEVMGAGMVHPKVFEAVKYDPYKLTGFAFGLGMERLAMIKYNIPDIRLFHSGDLRFIRQF